MNGGLIAMLVCLVLFGIIILTIIMLKKHTKLFHKDEKPDDQTITHQELNRMLQDVDDEDTKKAMEQYKNEHPQDEKKEEDHQ